MHNAPLIEETSLCSSCPAHTQVVINLAFSIDDYIITVGIRKLAAFIHQPCIG